MDATRIEGVLGIHYTSQKNWITGKVDLHPVVGVLPPAISEGDTVAMEGRWQDSNYGRQFAFRKCKSIRPKGVNGVKQYLIGNFKWIGPAIAERIIQRFGEGFFDVVESDHLKLVEISGITKKRADEIRDVWQKSKADKKAGVFFATCRITPAFQNRILAAYPKKSVDQVMEIIKKNPFRLVEKVEGIGFKTADRIARLLDFDTASPFRIRAGIFHALHEAAEGNGHCYLPAKNLVKNAADLLSVSPEMVAKELAYLLENEKLETIFKNHVCLNKYLAAENRVATKLKAIAAHAIARVMTVISKDEWEWLTPRQREAISCAMASNLMVFTGLPGSGKTTTLNAMVKALGDLVIALCAPTGKASKRMSQQIGRDASTIHRLLEYHPEFGFRVNRDNPINVDVVIIDETTMADILLFDAVLDAIDPKHTQLILVGDVNQLPSVGPGRVLDDIIASGVCPVIQLTEILRQDKASFIVKNAHAINAGKGLVHDNQQDFFYAAADDVTKIVKVTEMTLCAVKKKFDLDPIRDVQVLCPANKSAIGADALNPFLSNLLNPDGTPIKGTKLKVGDKAMQRKNNYQRLVFGEKGRAWLAEKLASNPALKWSRELEVDFSWKLNGDAGYGAFNGDSGVVHSFIAGLGMILVAFDDGLYSLYRPYEAESELMPSWAVSIHKSQGSEYPAVIIPIHTTNYMMLQRNLLYTGITRAARYLFLIGSPKAIRIAIANNAVTKRFTNLRALLEGGAT